MQAIATGTPPNIGQRLVPGCSDRGTTRGHDGTWPSTCRRCRKPKAASAASAMVAASMGCWSCNALLCRRRVPASVANWPKHALGRRLAVKERKGRFRHREKGLVRPVTGCSEECVREDGIGVGHARLEPQPFGRSASLIAIDKLPRRVPGDVFQCCRVHYARSAQMVPGQYHVGLGSWAAHLDERGHQCYDQLAGQSAMVVGQLTAQHFGQSSHRLSLAIIAALGIQPTALIAEEIVKSSIGTLCKLHKAQIAGHTIEHWDRYVHEYNRVQSRKARALSSVVYPLSRRGMLYMACWISPVESVMRSKWSKTIQWNGHYRPPCKILPSSSAPLLLRQTSFSWQLHMHLYRHTLAKQIQVLMADVLPIHGTSVFVSARRVAY